MLDPDFLLCELLTVPLDVAARAAAEISGCEACNEDAELPFDCILADEMNRPGSHGPVTEKTLVDRVGGIEVSA